MEFPAATADHAWLLRMAGDYEIEGGTETIRPLGEKWLLVEGSACEGDVAHRYAVTIGFDDAKGRYVGSFVGSLMSNLWVYEGYREGDSLILECEGPAFDPEKGSFGDGAMQYRDTITFDGKVKTLVSTVQNPDGTWTEIMRSVATKTS